MSNKFERSLGLRFISSISVLALISALIYVIFAGFNLTSTLIVFSAFGGLAGQAIYVGESIGECIVCFFEIAIESITSLFEAIGSIFNF